MACSPKPLQDLSKHFSLVSTLPLPTSFPSRSEEERQINLTTNFRTDSISNYSRGEHNSSSYSIGNEFDNFTRGGGGGGGGGNTSNYKNNRILSNSTIKPASQIQAMPPIYSLPSTTSFSSLSSSSLSPSSFSPLYPESEEEEDENSSSATWNPEFITQTYLSLHSTKPTYANSTYSPASRPSLGPTFDEAITISSSRNNSLPPSPASGQFFPVASTSGGGGGELEGRKNETPPHPLTFETPSHSAWDYNKLFSNKRSWYGGVRMLGTTSTSSSSLVDDTSEVEILQNGVGSEGIEGKGEGENSFRSGLRNSSRSKILGRRGGGEEEKRQVEVFESLRRVAMERLRAVGGHFV